MANSSFFKSSGTSSTTESTIAAQVNNASTSATNAASSATAAASSASAASTSETNASNSSTSASSSATTAQTHANTATTKAGEASTSASTASGHASTATTQATTATTQATTATTQAGLSSDHRSDAGKYAVTNHNTTFSLSSTNGGTSGLYSAKHYATEASNSATSAQNIVDGGINNISDVTITSVADNEVLAYDSSSSKFINQTPAEAGLLTGNETITLSGDVSGSGTTSIAVTIADDSHNHTIANVDDLQTTLDAKAPLASPTLTGNPTAPTQSASDNSTKIATTAYADTAISNLVDSSPAALNTLNELAAALGDDANFSTTVTNSIATKMPLAGGTFTGDVIFDSTNSSSHDLTWDTSEGELIFNDSAKAYFGTDKDMQITSTHIFARVMSETSILQLANTKADGDIWLQTDDGSGGLSTYIKCDGGSGEVNISHYGAYKLNTKSTGIQVDGNVETTGDIELGHDSDTTITRASAGVVNINSNQILTTATGAAISHTQASSTITDFASAASAEAIPFAIALG